MQHRYYDLRVPFIGSVILEARRRPSTSPFFEAERTGAEIELWCGGWYVILSAR